jgi:Spy/CpxP family protein refolding chaperone
MKKIVAIGGIIFLVVVIATYVLAHGPGRWGDSHMMGDWGCSTDYYSQNEKLTDEQRSQMDEFYQKFHDETDQLRNNIWEKSAELDALLNSSEPDAGKAKALQKEVSELKAKLAQERISYDLEARGGPEDRTEGQLWKKIRRMGRPPHGRLWPSYERPWT